MNRFSYSSRPTRRLFFFSSGILSGMKPHISLVTLGVDDVRRATDFYVKLGLSLSSHSTADVSFFELEGSWLGLFSREDLAKDAGVAVFPPGRASFSLAHNVSSKEAVDEVFVWVRECGARVIKEPHDASWGGYSGYFEDPDGYLWEVAWNPHFTPGK